MPSTGVVTISRTVGLTGAQAEFVSELVADIEAAECKNVSLKYTKATRLPPYLVTAPKLRLGVGSEEKLIDISVSQFFEILGAFPDLLSSEEAVLDKDASLETEVAARLLAEVVAAPADPGPDTANADAPAPEQGPKDNPKSPRVGPKPRASKGVLDTSSVGSAPRRSAIVPEPAELDADLSWALTSVGLSGYAMVLRTSHIVSLLHLRAHTVKELELSLKRKNGARFSFSSVDRKLWQSLDLAVEPEESKPRPTILGSKPIVSLQSDDVEDEEMEIRDLNKSLVQLSNVPDWSMSPCAHLLFAGVPDFKIELSTLMRVHERLHIAVMPTVPVDPPEDVEEAVQAIDVVLTAGVSSGLWDSAEISAPRAGVEAVVKHSRVLVAAAAQASSRIDANSKKSPTSDDGSGQMALASSILQASENSRPLSEKDAKVAEELEASKQRIEVVAASPSLLATMKQLAEVVGVQSAASDEQKLRAFATTCNKSEQVAALLKASHVRQPAAGTASSERVASVAAYRAVRQGVHTAQIARLRDLLADDAVAKPLVEAVAAGKLLDSDDSLKMGSMHDASKPPTWLGGKDAKLGQHLSAAAKSLVQLSLAMPPVILAMTELHPQDASIGVTMAVVQAEMAKGLRVLPAADVVAGVLMPLLREWGERWDAFQKSAASPMPTLGVAWQKVRQGRTVSAYLVRVENAPIQTGESGSTKEFASKGQLKSVDDQLKALRRRMASMSGDEDEDAEPVPGRKNRRKNKNKGVTGTVPPGTAPAAPAAAAAAAGTPK